MKKKARIFGRVGEDGNYLNLFECSCGSQDWITEGVETTRIFLCRKCGESYVLQKNYNMHYTIKNNKPEE